MMPEPYAKLIPIPSNPCYKYTSEGAGEFIFVFLINMLANFGFLVLLVKNAKNVFIKTNPMLLVRIRFESTGLIITRGRKVERK